MTELDLKSVLAELRETPDLQEEDLRAIEQLNSDQEAALLAATFIHEPSVPAAQVAASGVDGDDLGGDVRSKIRDMKQSEKIKLALYGNSICRAVLIFDASKIIQKCVLKNPKLTVGEVEEFAKSPNIAQQVLREISGSREWMKSYALRVTLVTNSKTPGDIALKWIRFLTANDLKKISRSKNIPQVVVMAARKRISESEQ